jgi:nitrite reductase/ring-hydroxylating ferredoxin subunit
VAGRMVVAMRDPVVLGRLGQLAARYGLDIVDDPTDGPLDGPSEPATTADEPTAAVAELELPGAIDRIARWRGRWPDSVLAGSIRVPDQELWHGALAAGADLVANRGAFVAQLERALVARGSGSGVAAGVRLPVRLTDRPGDGLVGRLPDAPGGSIAIFRVGERLCAVRDECPHAGASLADGVLEGTIVTCPRHGSQFDVVTGSRERGPSDFPIRTYRVLMADGITWVEVPA